jgi:regulator of replication initiation timing
MATIKKLKKNDSLSKYREELVKKNKNLVQKACDYIRSIGGEINYSNVAKATASVIDINNNEKPLTAAAISKNDEYKSIINAEAKKASSSGTAKTIRGKVAQMGLADLSAELFEQRTENHKLKREIKVLKDQLAAIPTLDDKTKGTSSTDNKENEETIRAASNLVKFLLEQELAYLDLESEELRLATFGTPMLKGNPLLRLLKGTPYEDKIQKRGS